MTSARPQQRANAAEASPRRHHIERDEAPAMLEGTMAKPNLGRRQETRWQPMHGITLHHFARDWRMCSVAELSSHPRDVHRCSVREISVGTKSCCQTTEDGRPLGMC